MTTVQVRLRPEQHDRVDNLLLDWFEDNASASTIGYKKDFLSGVMVGAVAKDLLHIGGAVFAADKTILRADASDSWTRDIAVTVPVSDPARWAAAEEQLERTLRFLSGDRWSFIFEPLPPVPSVDDPPRRSAPNAQTTFPIDPYDAVCLFSGGLDSLAGGVELLESGRRPLFIGHHESGKPNKLQGDLFELLKQHYGDNSCELRRIYLAPRPANSAQARPLPNERERTTRSRSFLFLSAAAALADAVGPGTPIVMPENGFIGINVPLTDARVGSLSTRTTHPQFMVHMTALFARLGLDHTIENPFRLKTKGEVLADSAHPALLQRLAPHSVSCSHPESGRWIKGSTAQDQGNCGACYPCLIRGAAMHHVGWPDAVHRYNPLSLKNRDLLLAPSKKTGASVQAVREHLRQPPTTIDVLRNGRIPNREARDFDGVYRRGRDELTAWLSSGPHPLIS